MTAALDRTSTTPKRVLMVVANPTTSTTTGWPVGFWASELFHPLYEFTEAGYEVTVASPEGGSVEVDALSDPRDLKVAVARFYEAEKPTAALCHGVSALVDVRLSDSSYLVEGRTVTGFANVEEAAADEAVGTKVMPWRIEDALRERGANYVEGGLWKAFAIRDGRLITGQQQYSGRKVAALVIEALGA